MRRGRSPPAPSLRKHAKPRSKRCMAMGSRRSRRTRQQARDETSHGARLRSASWAQFLVAERTNLNARALSRFTVELSSLIGSGIALDEAFRVMAASDRGSVGRTASALLKDVLAGAQLSQAMRTRPKTFGEEYCAIVAAGEGAGALAPALAQIAGLLARRLELRSKISAALVYPAVLVLMSIVSVGVKRFHTIAPANAAATISWVTTAGLTISDPTILATAVDMNAPATLRTPGRSDRHKRAHDSRRDDGRNGVGTVMPPVRKVEQERQHHHNEQHSCQVRHGMFVKSKRWKVNVWGRFWQEPNDYDVLAYFHVQRFTFHVSRSLVVFERDPLKNVCNVFATVGSCFEVLVNFFPHDHRDWISFFFEESRNRIAGDSVGLILQTVHLHAAFLHLRMRKAQEVHTLPHSHRSLVKNVGELDRHLGRLRHLV